MSAHTDITATPPAVQSGVTAGESSRAHVGGDAPGRRSIWCGASSSAPACLRFADRLSELEVELGDSWVVNSVRHSLPLPDLVQRRIGDDEACRMKRAQRSGDGRGLQVERLGDFRSPGPTAAAQVPENLGACHRTDCFDGVEQVGRCRRTQSAGHLLIVPNPPPSGEMFCPLRAKVVTLSIHSCER